MKALPKSTSEEPAFPEEQRLLFIEVLRLMNRYEIPYAVSGAFALHEHTGIWRNTKDLDLFLPSEHANRALEVMKQEGMKTEVADEIWIAKAHHNGYYVDLITGMNNAAVQVDMSWVRRATPYTLFGVPTRVLPAEELIASKIFVARRERFDGSDICHLIYRAGHRLDWEHLLRLVSKRGDHRGLLFFHLVLFRYVYPGSSHLVPRRVWDELIDRFKEGIGNRDPQADFRGSLIDENMFLIDVAEWGLPNLIDDLREAREPKICEDGRCSDRRTLAGPEPAGTPDDARREAQGGEPRKAS
jgi:hypothetical protein